MTRGLCVNEQHGAVEAGVNFTKMDGKPSSDWEREVTVQYNDAWSSLKLVN